MTPSLDLSFRPAAVGLIADSHSNHAAITACIRRLWNNGVHRLVHLGDVFDSLKYDQLGEMINTLGRHGVATVKGNNDFQLQNLISGGGAPGLPIQEKSAALAFLENLPLKITDQHVCFTHSLPFESIRSLYEPVDNGTTDRAKQVFDQTPYRLVCCGHSHSPVLFRCRGGRITRETIAIGETLFLDPAERYIIVVGASDRGECGVLDPGRNTYERVHIGSPLPDKGLPAVVKPETVPRVLVYHARTEG